MACRIVLEIIETNQVYQIRRESLIENWETAKVPEEVIIAYDMSGNIILKMDSTKTTFRKALIEELNRSK